LEEREELYILDKGGQIVYYFNTSQTELDENEHSRLLTASYLTGVLQFARKASGDFISTFELGKLNIMLKLGGGLPLYYVFIVGKKVKLNQKKADKLLSQIIEAFEAVYTIERLNEWNGDIYAFDDFTPTVKRILKVK